MSSLKILKWYFIIINILIVACKIISPSYYPFAVCIYMVAAAPVFGIIRLIKLNAISAYIHDKYPVFYKRYKSVTLRTQSNWVSSYSLFEIKDEELKSDGALIKQIDMFKFAGKLAGFSFVLVIVYALLIFA